MVATLLAKSSVRFYQKHPLQLLLSIVGIVLGVCIVSAVLITNSSSKKAFALSTDALYGRVNYQIVAPRNINQSDYVTLKKQFPKIKMAPIIEGYVSVNNSVYTLLGIDPFAELELARGGFAFPETIDTKLLHTMLSSDGIVLSKSELQKQQQSQTTTSNNPTYIYIEAGEASFKSPVLGSYPSSNALASQGLLIADIAYAQDLLAMEKHISRIDLLLSDEQRPAVAAALPATLKLLPAARAQQTMQAMTRGFQINLTAMSLLSLLVGAFLIHNTMTFAVLQRRELFAVKRIVGLSASSILLTVLMEALIISIIGSCIGVILGYYLSTILIQLTTQTINDLYFVLHVQQVWLSPSTIVISVLLGLGTSLLAASLSAIQAAQTNPLQARRRSAVELNVRKLLPALMLLGIVAIVLGSGIALIPSQSLLLGFIALMLIIFGYGLALPWVCLHGSRLLKKVAKFIGPVTTIATASIEHNISRTGLAIAALTIAVSSTFGVDVMIGSFRSSVDHWLASTLHSDIYISSPSNVSARADGTLNEQAIDSAKMLPNIRSFSFGRTIKVNTQFGAIDMLALQPHNNDNGEFPQGITLLNAQPEQSWQQFFSSKSVLISEPLANKHNLAVGQSLSVFTTLQGDMAFTIAGIYRDYGTSFGKLTMYREQYIKYFNDSDISAIGIKFEATEGVEKEQIVRSAIAALRDSVRSNNQAIQINANSDIHRESLAVFDRTFAVTEVLRWLTVGVAFIGIFSALLAMNLERTQEFAILRASGATKTQTFGIITIQTFLMGLIAGVLALPLGWIMSQVLIHVINVRSFGWSMQGFIQDNAISSTLLLAISSALLAGIYPAWSLSRRSIAARLREE